MRPVAKWLPKEYIPILYKLARADELSVQLMDVLTEYMRVEPLELVTDHRDGREFCHLKRVTPPPPKIGLLFGDAINQLRSCLDHAVLTSIEQERGVSLDSILARQTEFPVCRNKEAFSMWLKKRVRNFPELTPGSTLAGRLEDLQPFSASQVSSSATPPQHDQSEQLFKTPLALDSGAALTQHHPLLGLAAWSNEDKHRRLSVALVRSVYRGVLPVPGFHHDTPEYEWLADDHVLTSGTDLFSVPEGTVMVADIYPYPAIRRPETGLWRPIPSELNLYQRYVAEFAIPFLLVGSSEVQPLPSRLSTTMPTDNLSDLPEVVQGYAWKSQEQNAKLLSAVADVRKRDQERIRGSLQ